MNKEYKNVKIHICRAVSVLSILSIIMFCGWSYDAGSEVLNNTNMSSSKNTKKVIVLDPGHGSRVNRNKELIAPWSTKKCYKAAIGATGIISKTPEYAINMQVALKVKKLLEEKKFKVIMTKDNIKENPGNIERAQIGNKANAELVVKIHADSYRDSSARGTTVLVPSAERSDRKELAEGSLKCGRIILNTLVKEAHVKSRGIRYKENITSFNWSRVPIILIELGFLSNKKEDMLLNSKDYQNKLAGALTKGIEKAVLN